MVDFLELKDIVMLAFFALALWMHGRSCQRKGIEDGVEGAITSLERDGFIEVDKKTGEIVRK